MSKPLLPPPDAEVLTTACDYCAVGCGYKVYRWPVGTGGAAAAGANALGTGFPHDGGNYGQLPWISPAQHNLVMHGGRPHHVAVLADHATRVVNPHGNHSMRGGTLAQKCFNPATRTKERLRTPLIRIGGELVPASWDLALDVMAEISREVLDRFGEHAWAVKSYSYQYFENTYAITRLALTSVGTPAFAPHDKCADTNDAAGLDDAGIDAFSASYADWGECDTLFMSGVDPFETKTTLFTSWIMGGANTRKALIFATPYRSAGVAWGESQGGLWLPVVPGTDTLLHNALARLIIENGWQDQEFIDAWVAKEWEVSAGYGRGTRNTPWQWRTTWGAWQSDWRDYRAFILGREEHRLENAARLTGLEPAAIRRCAELLARPQADGRRPKTSFMLEKGNYWSNNYMNSASLAALGLICGAGNRPGRVIARGGGHQRGMISAGGGADWLSPEKYPGRRKKPLNLDRWLIDGQVRFAWVFGTTWIGAMAASQDLQAAFDRLTRASPHQPRRLERAEILDAWRRRMDAGGMVLVDSDIYPVEPLGTRYADVVLPAATWGEADFTRCNGERRLRLYSAFYDPPGEARPDWWAVREFAKRMGFEGYDWPDANAVFEEAARFSRGGPLDYAALVAHARARGEAAHEALRRLGTQGIQTPIRRRGEQLLGTVRLHDPIANAAASEGVAEGEENARALLHAFRTHSGKAVLLKSPWDFPGWSQFYRAIAPRAERGEIWITNGRINEVWQSGFDDLRKSYLAPRAQQALIFIHPRDAALQGVESGDLVRVVNDTVYVQIGMPQGVLGEDQHFDSLLANGHIRETRGEFVALALVTENIRPGVAKASFNHPGAAANAVVHAVVDPLTNNYRYKLGRGRLERLGASPDKESLAGISFKSRGLI